MLRVPGETVGGPVPAAGHHPDPDRAPLRTVQEPRRGFRPAPGAPSLGRTVVLFGLGSLVPLLVLLVGVVLIIRGAAAAEALRGAEDATDLLAVRVVQPALTDGLLTGEPEAWAQVDRVVRDSVLSDSVLRVKLWTPEGRVVYSDETRLIGQRFALEPDHAEALRSGKTVAEISTGSGRENRFEQDQGPLLEVYRPVLTPGGAPLLFETYSRSAQHSARTADIAARFVPIAVAALVLFPLCQLPLVSSLVRRLRDGQEERERLLVRASHASELERRRIAADIHDTVVQSLVGAGYVVAGTADDLDAAGRPDGARRLRTAAQGIRESVRGLRSLLVQVYPPDVARAGLGTALQDLVAPLRAQGLAVDVDVDVPDGVQLDQGTEALLFRVVQEAVRNASRHAAASTVALRLRVEADRVVLELQDDGVGFVLDDALSSADGHVGLRIVHGLVGEAGGGLAVATAPGQGTRLRVEVPAP